MQARKTAAQPASPATHSPTVSSNETAINIGESARLSSDSRAYQSDRSKTDLVLTNWDRDESQDDAITDDLASAVAEAWTGRLGSI